MSVVYRDAAASDAAAIDHIFRTSFRDTFEHLYRPEDLDAFFAGFTSEAWLAELADPAFAFRVAEANGEVAGYVKLGPPALPVEPSGKAIELRQLYLLKQWHGAGIARALMDWALDESRRRGASELYLTVYTDNVRARRLYERYGFEVLGPYAFMVGSKADEDLIMRLRL